jgi:MFS family permease
MNKPASTFTRGHWMALIAALLGWMFDGFEMGLFPLIGNPALHELLGVTQMEEELARVRLELKNPPTDADARAQLAAREIGLTKDIQATKETSSRWFAVIMAMFLVGAATGGVLFGWLGDRVGRVRALSLSILTYALFTGFCGFATEAWQIAALRFVASLGMGGEWALGVSLVIEIWPDRSRAFLAGLIGAAANVGFFLVGIISLTLNSLTESVTAGLAAMQLPEATVAALTSNSMWRLLMIVGALPALLVFMIRLFVPESEKWHAEQKRGATSHWATIDLVGVLVGCIGAVGVIFVWSPIVTEWPAKVPLQAIVSPLGLAVSLLGFMYPVLRYLKRAAAAGSLRGMDGGTVVRRMLFGASLTSVALLGTWGTLQWTPKWADGLTNPTSKQRSIAPGTPTWLLEHPKEYTQMATATAATIATILAALAGGWLGRRPTYFLLCLGSIASALWLFQMNSTFGVGFLVSVFFMGGITAAFYGVFPLYLPELFPTSVRSTTQGFAYNFGRIVAAVGNLQTAAMLVYFKGDFARAGTVMCLIYLIGAVIIWFGPETKNQPLPE